MIALYIVGGIICLIFITIISMPIKHALTPIHKKIRVVKENSSYIVELLEVDGSWNRNIHFTEDGDVHKTSIMLVSTTEHNKHTKEKAIRLVDEYIAFNTKQSKGAKHHSFEVIYTPPPPGTTQETLQLKAAQDDLLKQMITATNAGQHLEADKIHEKILLIQEKDNLR